MRVVPRIIRLSVPEYEKVFRGFFMHIIINPEYEVDKSKTYFRRIVTWNL